MSLKVEDIQQAQKLITKLADYMADERAALESLQESLNEYVEFLQLEIKAIREGEK